MSFTYLGTTSPSVDKLMCVLNRMEKWLMDNNKFLSHSG
jgi:hypothetical protein